MTGSPDQPILGLLPQPEGRRRSFVVSSIANLMLLGICLLIGMSAPKVIEQHYEETQLITPILPPHPKIKHLRLTAPSKHMPKPKSTRMQARLSAPPIRHFKPHMTRTPRPRPALAAAMPAQNRFVHPSVKPVHLGDTFGVTPNPNARHPANVAALGNPYGDLRGPAVAPHGVVRSAGFGDSTRAGEGGGGSGGGGWGYGAGSGSGDSTSVEVLSRPPAEYNAEARQLGIEGDVVLSVTFLASGRVVVHGVLHGLGHGLNREAIRVAEQIRFRPATRNGRPVDVTTHVTISFQLA